MWSLGIVRPASNWIADMEISIDRLMKESLSETIAEELFRLIAAQALALFRQFHIISALIDASGSEAWMNRIILLQRETWTAMAGQDWDRARALGLAAAEDWRKDVTPQFAG